MLVFLGFTILVLIAGFIVLQQRQLGGSIPTPELPSLHRNVFSLQIGDIVQYDLRDWIVEGKLIYTEAGFSWFEYLVQDGDDIRWLSVSEDDTVDVSWLQTVTDLEISGTPPKTIDYNGVTYTQEDNGVASMKRIGTVQHKRAESCRYYDYEGPGRLVMSIENWDGDIEVSIGQSIRPSELTLLPGSGETVYRDR
ncbi:MAG: DUF4178 domain-containing protein [Oscillatoriales cyanobacterium]|nr:MAG: DUF4178 domain-containing protein [Oscillatoriales cyanobacterium]